NPRSLCPGIREETLQPPEVEEIGLAVPPGETLDELLVVEARHPWSPRSCSCGWSCDRRRGLRRPGLGSAYPGENLRHRELARQLAEEVVLAEFAVEVHRQPDVGVAQRLLNHFGWTLSSIRMRAQLLRRQWKSTRFEVAPRCGIKPA